MRFRVPRSILANCFKSPDREAWLQRLPSSVKALEQKWSLTVGRALDGPDVTCSFVAPATRADGTTAILKIGMPHFEAQNEIQGLRFWSGNPTVQLLEFDAGPNAMLLERCNPGTSLRQLSLPEQDIIIAALLPLLWRACTKPHPFRHLSALTAYWTEEAESQKENWPDEGLVRDGLRLFHDLPRTAATQVLLATDLHAGNILRAQRKPWLVIDPKPFVGDPTYDATQHLLNNLDELSAHPFERIHRLADLLELDRTRLQQWLFGRLAAGPRDDWRSHASHQSLHLARKLAL